MQLPREHVRRYIRGRRVGFIAARADRARRYKQARVEVQRTVARQGAPRGKGFRRYGSVIYVVYRKIVTMTF